MSIGRRSGGGRMFRRGPRRRSIVSARALSVGAGGALIGAMVLAAATSSAQGSVEATADHPTRVTPPSLVDVAAGRPVSLLGFAPPPVPVAGAGGTVIGDDGTPQFRTAVDLPTGPLGIPGVVLQAYKLAADRLGSEEPACKLPWFLLAGIGRIESHHAGNGNVDASGTTLSPINGPSLDGTLPGNEVIKHDSGGFARAMGPMQFIPSTWATWGADANGDGKADPNNVFDATYSAGRYLCAGFTNIMSDNNKVAAVFRYNHSMAYVTNVLAWATAYATGVMPTNPIPDPVPDKPSRSSSAKPSKPSGKPPKSSSPSSAPSSEPSSPTSTPPPPNCVLICLPPIQLPGLPGLPPPPAPAKPRPAPGKPHPAPQAPPAH